MSYILLEEGLLDKLNMNCHNRSDNGFCQWDSDHIQPGNQREYCVWIDYGHCRGFNSTASHAELCESCEKLLIKCSIALLSWKVELLEMEVAGLRSKMQTQIADHSKTEPDLSNSS